jgi:hypothetical protein
MAAWSEPSAAAQLPLDILEVSAGTGVRRSGECIFDDALLFLEMFSRRNRCMSCLTNPASWPYPLHSGRTSNLVPRGCSLNPEGLSVLQS